MKESSSLPLGIIHNFPNDQDKKNLDKWWRSIDRMYNTPTFLSDCSDGLNLIGWQDAINLVKGSSHMLTKYKEDTNLYYSSLCDEFIRQLKERKATSLEEVVGVASMLFELGEKIYLKRM